MELHCYYTITWLSYYEIIISSFTWHSQLYLRLELAYYNMDGLKDTIGGDYKNKYDIPALWARLLF